MLNWVTFSGAVTHANNTIFGNQTAAGPHNTAGKGSLFGRGVVRLILRSPHCLGCSINGGGSEVVTATVTVTVTWYGTPGATAVLFNW